MKVHLHFPIYRTNITIYKAEIKMSCWLLTSSICDMQGFNLYGVAFNGTLTIKALWNA